MKDRTLEVFGPAVVYHETPCPFSTPWGPRQHFTRKAPGLYFVSTYRHGGLWMSIERLERFKQLFPCFEGYAGLPWLEEDCDYCAGVLAFPECFSAEIIHFAVDFVLTYKSSETPPVYYFGVVRDWLLSDAGQPLRKIADLFAASKAGQWRRGGCCTEGRVWRTHWYKGTEYTTTVTPDYVTENWMTDAQIEANHEQQAKAMHEAATARAARPGFDPDHEHFKAMADSVAPRARINLIFSTSSLVNLAK